MRSEEVGFISFLAGGISFSLFGSRQGVLHLYLLARLKMANRNIKHNNIRLNYKEGVYQYLIDHSRLVVGKGGKRIMKITFFLRDQVHWDDCVAYRRNGVYRIDDRQLEKEFQKQIWAKKMRDAYSEIKGKRVEEIHTNGSWFEKGLLWLNKWSYKRLFREELKLSYYKQYDKKQDSKGGTGGDHKAGGGDEVSLEVEE